MGLKFNQKVVDSAHDILATACTWACLARPVVIVAYRFL